MVRMFVFAKYDHEGTFRRNHGEIRMRNNIPRPARHANFVGLEGNGVIKFANRFNDHEKCIAIFWFIVQAHLAQPNITNRKLL